MAAQSEAVSAAAIEVIDSVLRRWMGRYGFTTAQVGSGPDYLGDPVLFIDALYGAGGDVLEPGAAVGLISELRDALEAVGETRFPHVRHDFPEDQPIAQWGKRGAKRPAGVKRA